MLNLVKEQPDAIYGIARACAGELKDLAKAKETFGRFLGLASGEAKEKAQKELASSRRFTSGPARRQERLKKEQEEKKRLADEEKRKKALWSRRRRAAPCSTRSPTRGRRRIGPGSAQGQGRAQGRRQRRRQAGSDPGCQAAGCRA